MEVSSGMASSISLSQMRARQNFTMSAMERDAKAERSMMDMLVDAVGKGKGSVAADRGRKIDISV